MSTNKELLIYKEKYNKLVRTKCKQTKHLHYPNKSVKFGILIAIGQATKRFVHRRLNSAGKRTARSRKRT